MRQCGECTVCCTQARVPELDKPERVLCRHCSAGCSVYAERPQSCRTFECAWLKGEMSEQERPDRVGVMVEDHGAFVFAMCDGGEWRSMGALDEYVRAGRPVVIGSRTGNALLLPEGTDPRDVIKLVREAL